MDNLEKLEDLAKRAKSLEEHSRGVDPLSPGDIRALLVGAVVGGFLLGSAFGYYWAVRQVNAVLDERRTRRERKITFKHKHLDNVTLDYYWEDDTIDIKNYRNMEPGEAKDAFGKQLEERMKWYEKLGLNDWADQIHYGLLED